VVSVALSITSLDQSLARVMEPRTSSPAARLGAMEKLAAAGVPAMAMVAPTIPGLNDSEMPQILEAAKNAGARAAAYILLRLPLNVRPVFLDWLARTQPERKERVESRIRATREGKLSDARFGSRMRGKGEIADQIARTFKVFARKFGLDRKLPEPDTSAFRRPRPSTGQLHLF
jgi:DNA repair photolyase